MRERWMAALLQIISPKRHGELRGGAFSRKVLIIHLLETISRIISPKPLIYSVWGRLKFLHSFSRAFGKRRSRHGNHLNWVETVPYRLPDTRNELLLLFAWKKQSENYLHHLSSWLKWRMLYILQESETSSGKIDSVRFLKLSLLSSRWLRHSFASLQAFLSE